jgi:hypothetical protein
MNRPLAILKKSALFGSLSLLLVAGPAVADIPDNLVDINYQDVGWGGQQLRMRGYTYIDGDFRDGKLHEYWWNGRSNTCVHTRAESGKYEMLKTTGPTDCNQYGTQASSGGSNEGNNAAAIAIGAAAILGAVALAHKSHERDDRHGQDSKSVAEFDRGYRDGLYHQSYHNYNNTPAYSDGYNVGQQRRHEQTSYRPNHGRYSGYHPYVSVDDLVGANAASADSALRQRGFRDTGGYKQDKKSYVTWYNASTRQCVQAVTKNGRIKHLDSVNEGNCR